MWVLWIALLNFTSQANAEDMVFSGLNKNGKISVQVKELCVNPLLQMKLQAPYKARIQLVRGWYGDIVKGSFPEAMALKDKEPRNGLKELVDLKFSAIMKEIITFNGPGTPFRKVCLHCAVDDASELTADFPLVDFKLMMAKFPAPVAKNAIDTAAALLLTIETANESPIFSTYIFLPTKESVNWVSDKNPYALAPKEGSVEFVAYEAAQNDGKFFEPSKGNTLACDVSTKARLKVIVSNQ